MRDMSERARSQSQQPSRSASRSNSPGLSPQTSHANARPAASPHRPLLRRYRSSLADLAREHKLHSRRASTNDTRKFFGGDDDAEYDHSFDSGYDESTDEFVLLSRSPVPGAPAAAPHFATQHHAAQHLQAPHHAAHHAVHHLAPFQAPQSAGQHHAPAAQRATHDGPSFLFRTGSRVFAQAGLELGESRHNSPSASAAVSRSISPAQSDDEGADLDAASVLSSADSDASAAGCLIMFDLRGDDTTSSDDSDADAAPAPARAAHPAWAFVLRDVLGFDLARPRTASGKQRRRAETTGILDPALAVALFAAFAR